MWISLTGREMWEPWRVMRKKLPTAVLMLRPEHILVLISTIFKRQPESSTICRKATGRVAALPRPIEMILVFKKNSFICENV